MKTMNLAAKARHVVEYCQPRTIARLNDHEVRLSRLNGPFIWHFHENGDELFFVIDGHLTMETREGNHELSAGDLLVVPKRVEHRPVAPGDVLLMLIEPASTRNTGNVVNHLTAVPEIVSE